jgi:NTE family protein
MQVDPSKASVSPDRDPLLVDLALQGGGAHGAYTWGVLDLCSKSLATD